MRHAASAISAPDTDHLSGYWLFREAVAQAQLAAWLTPGRHLLVDVSGPRAAGAELAAQCGHTVLRIFDARAARAEQARTEQARTELGRAELGRAELGRAELGRAEPGRAERGSAGRPAVTPGPDTRAGQDGRQGRRSGPGQRAKPRRPGRIFRLVADSSRLAFLADGCADGVIADDRALSTHLAAEAMIAEIARVLRPDGRVLACVDSLVLGMAVLADQHHWAHLVDLPHAEVVLVPWPDGTITRCYGPDQARELFSGAGLAVNWIRSRTLLSQSMVTRVLRHDPASLPELVRAELAAKSDESLGAQLVISARKPRKRRASGGWQASGADGRTWPGS